MPRLNNRRMRWCVAALTAAFAGCVAGPNFVAPPAPTASSYTADSMIDASLPEPDRWWAPLNSPRLDSAIAQALTANRSLDAARATLAELSACASASVARAPSRLRLAASA